MKADDKDEIKESNDIKCRQIEVKNRTYSRKRKIGNKKIDNKKTES